MMGVCMIGMALFEQLLFWRLDEGVRPVDVEAVGLVATDIFLRSTSAQPARLASLSSSAPAALVCVRRHTFW